MVSQHSNSDKVNNSGTQGSSHIRDDLRIPDMGKVEQMVNQKQKADLTNLCQDDHPKS